jgi:hypothetical protein
MTTASQKTVQVLEQIVKVVPIGTNPVVWLFLKKEVHSFKVGFE